MGSSINLADRSVAGTLRHLPVRGRAQVARRRWQHSAPGRIWEVPLKPNLRVRLPSGSLQSWIAAFTGGYDADHIALLTAWFKPGTVALDVGASLGLYTLPLAAAARANGGRVIAFEPVPANVSIIEANLAANQLAGSAEVRPVALADRPLTIALDVEPGGAGNAAIVDAGPVTATAVRLDDEELPAPVSVIKADVEGFEFDVLAGGTERIQTDRPVISGEFNGIWLAERGRDLGWLAEWAKMLDYRLIASYRYRTAWWRESTFRLKTIDAPVAGDMLLVPQELNIH